MKLSLETKNTAELKRLVDLDPLLDELLWFLYETHFRRRNEAAIAAARHRALQDVTDIGTQRESE
ncbi:hypothetical protein BWQ96_00826 [Gracilariopsis chorda]|uniref:Uncharacterized protein n=1 Tax=Gracilariopsis chorda TaxID=448386 RepID=A0A2V3J984_9FLOR|nr:hypothetical protein BWQ96_00826 [Gracilariopsis chorda]|eukprot:PXF49510.1 hypothetical protein BWQ96_00826 [Gracilariopsis chorda]